MKRSPSWRRHLPGLSAWVLWLALLLPLAQLAGAMHAYVHVSDPVRVANDKHLPAPCDLCVLAAALGSAAPGGTPPAPVQLALEQAAPRQDPAPSPDLAALSPYRSRAPPALPA
jgi:hypothetical protein